MKVTNFGPNGLPITLAGWSTGIVSLNSNVDIIGGGPQALNFVQRITSNTSNTLLNPIVNFASGSNIAFAVQSNTLTIIGTAAGGGGGAAPTISAGSNSTRVSEVSTAGSSTTLWSPYDHAHDGIGTITASSSNTLQRGTWNLRAGTGIALALTDTDGDGEFDTTTIVNTLTASSINAASSIHPLPLDSYALDGTYGDDFNTSSLAAKWTRRNFTSAAETYQLTPTGTFMRIAFTGRAVGDAYFQTAPAGDWTFAMSFIPRLIAGANFDWGIAVVNTVGTGVGTSFANVGATAFVVASITTYSTYGGAFQATTSDGEWQVASPFGHKKMWQYLRKSGTNYYASLSQNGETWMPETAAFSSSITVDRIGMIVHPVSAISTTGLIDVDLFNKIA